MPLVKVGSKHQVVSPKTVFDKLGLAPGDYVEIAVQKKQVVLKPKKVVDRYTEEPIGPKTRAAIQQAFAQTKAGKGHGPFTSAEDLIADLHRRVTTAK